MKRCVPLRRNVAEKPRDMRLKFVLSQLRTCTHESENMCAFFKSLRFYGEQESVESSPRRNHVCEKSFNMKHRISFCCTRPRTGSRDNHTCVASYTYRSWNICGKFKNRRRRESFRFQRRAEIKRSILAQTRFKAAFSSQNQTNFPIVW